MIDQTADEALGVMRPQSSGVIPPQGGGTMPSRQSISSGLQALKAQQESKQAEQAKNLADLSGRQAASQEAMGKELSVLPQDVDIPKPDKTIMNPRQASAMFPLLMIAAVLAGKGTANPAMTAMGNLTGLMKGQMEGDDARIQHEYDAYHENVNAAMNRLKEINGKRAEIYKKYQGDQKAIDEQMHLLRLEYGLDNNQFNQSYKALQAQASLIENMEKTHNTVAKNAEKLKVTDDDVKLAHKVAKGEILSTEVPTFNGQRDRVLRVLANPDAYVKDDHPAKEALSTYNSMDAKTARATDADFTRGVTARTVQSINAVSDHLETFRSLAHAVQNGDQQQYNKLKASWSIFFGGTAPNDVKAAAPIIGGEVVKAIIPGGGGVTEREESAKQWSNALATGQVDSQIDNVMIPMLKGQLSAMKTRYLEGTRGMKTEDDFNKKLTPGAKKLLGVSGGGRVTISSREELQQAIKAGKLKSGDTFVDPDGIEHTVR